MIDPEEKVGLRNSAAIDSRYRDPVNNFFGRGIGKIAGYHANRGSLFHQSP